MNKSPGSDFHQILKQVVLLLHSVRLDVHLEHLANALFLVKQTLELRNISFIAFYLHPFRLELVR